MDRPNLSRYFTGFAAKRLTKVEVDPSSNQHEFQGVKAMRQILGETERIASEGSAFGARYLYLSDEDEDSELSTLTWYNARRRRTKDGTRGPEWHAYYPSELKLVQERAEEGDLLLIARRSGDSLLVVIAQAGSSSESQLLWLFDLDPQFEGVRVESVETSRPGITPLAIRQLLEKLGIEVEDQEGREQEILARLLKKFGDTFPGTDVFSKAAREMVKVDPKEDPDGAIAQWFAAEERLFKGFERPFLARALESTKGAHGVLDVDAIITLMKSALQRRRSRAGKALENHLECVFQEHGLHYQRNGQTELKSRPDFLFPDERRYHSAKDDEVLYLSMLGVKSTAKDRWRQVIAEADRIHDKHLFTLEPAISTAQTAEMAKSRVTLVLPRELHDTYTVAQRQSLLDLSAFISIVRDRQQFWSARR